MNQVLQSLMGAMSPDIDRRLRRPWTTMVIHRNLGAVPATDTPLGNGYWNRGFLVLLVDDHGEPTHVCKIRPEHEPGTRNEGHVMQRLASDPTISDHLPPSFWAAVPGIQALVTAFVAGSSYDHRMTRIGSAQWEADTAEILMIARRISERAKALMPELLQGKSAVSLLEATTPGLESLDALRIEPERLGRLRNRLRSAEQVPASLQHGDLWPANLLYDRGDWRFLDFEQFGTVKVPLFDAIHLLRTSMPASVDEVATGRWLQRVYSDSADARACRRSLAAAAAREGISPNQAGACLIHYLTMFIHRAHLVHLPPPLLNPLLAEARTAADLLAESPGRLDALFVKG